jgi:hypothetical protein
MTDLLPHEFERLRRSVAMAPPGGPSGLSREKGLAVLSQLLEVTEHRDNLIAELVALGLA